MTMITAATRYVTALIWGFFEGLLPWVVVAVVMSQVIQATSWNISLVDHEGVVTSIASMLGLLNAFLVTTNINIAGRISDQVRVIQGTCTECALLSFAVMQRNMHQMEPVKDVLLYTLGAVLSHDNDAQMNDRVTNAIAQFLPQTSSQLDIQPPTAIALVNSINTVSSEYGRLKTLRAARTPPAIETLVYFLGVLNLAVATSSMSNVDIGVTTLVATFVSASSLGLLGISNVIKDPLRRSWMSFDMVESVLATQKNIRDLGERPFISKASGLHRKDTAQAQGLLVKNKLLHL